MKTKTLFYVLFIAISTASCCSFFGSYNLGNNIYLMAGDNENDRLIIFGEGKDIFGCCYSGTRIIPDEKSKYNEYVETTNYNKSWIIVRTYQINNKNNNYWIISKNFDSDNINADEIIQSYVTGPVDSLEFMQLLRQKDIDLEFEE